MPDEIIIMAAYNLIQEEVCVINKNASIFLFLSETDRILSQNYDWQTIAYKSNSSVDSVWLVQSMEMKRNYIEMK